MFVCREKAFLCDLTYGALVENVCSGLNWQNVAVNHELWPEILMKCVSRYLFGVRWYLGETLCKGWETFYAQNIL